MLQILKDVLAIVTMLVIFILQGLFNSKTVLKFQETTLGLENKLALVEKINQEQDELHHEIE